MSMKAKSGRRLARRCGGWGTSEYLVVLFFGMLAVWEVGQFVLARIREHHLEFSWALMVPF